MLMIHPGISTAPSAAPSLVSESRAMYVPVRPIPALTTAAKVLTFYLLSFNDRNAIDRTKYYKMFVFQKKMVIRRGSLIVFTMDVVDENVQTVVKGHLCLL